MKFYFHPHEEEEFKKTAVGKIVHTLVFDTSKQKVIINFSRKVNTIWEQTCKNNIATDHRIKQLKGKNYQIYSWVSNNKNDFNLPFFKPKE